MSTRLIIELDCKSPAVFLGDEVAAKMASDCLKQSHFIHEESSNHCFYNWIIDDTTLNGVWFHNCNDEIMRGVENLKRGYVTIGKGDLTVWFTSRRDGDYHPVVEWDAHFIKGDEGRIMLDLNIGGLPAMSYLPFIRSSPSMTV